MSRLSFVMRGGGVKRYHTHKIIGEQTVAAHSWGVAAILLEICEPSIDLMRAALYHDVFEYATGDVPYTAKANFPEIRDALVVAEEKIATSLEIDVMFNLAPEDEALLKTADMMELCYFCVEQMKLGNTFMAEVFDNGMRFLTGHLAHHPNQKASDLLADLSAERIHYGRE